MSTKRISIPRLDMKVNWDNPNEDARKIVTKVRPAWAGKDIEVEKLSGGFINMTLTCSVKDDTQVLTVRVFKAGGEVFSNREAELIGLCLSAETGAGKALHATFSNGLVMTFAPGTVLKYHELTNPTCMRAMGHSMGKLNSVDMAEFEIYDGDKKLQIPTKPMMFDQIDNNIKNIPDLTDKPERQERMLAFIGSHEKLEHEASLLRQHVEALHLDVVWCHNDAHQLNIIYDADTESACLIDHELGGPNYEIFDLARILVDITIYQTVGFATKEDKYPSPDVQKLMLKEYICARHLLKTGCDDISEKDVERSYTILQKFCVVAEFWWGCFALANMEADTIALDLMLVAETFMTAYWRNRATIFGA